jgi:hypothetical protein
MIVCPLIRSAGFEGRDGIAEGRDVADVRPQPSIPHLLHNLTQLGAIGLDNEVDRQAIRAPRLGRAGDCHQRSSGPADRRPDLPRSVPSQDATAQPGSRSQSTFSSPRDRSPQLVRTTVTDQGVTVSRYIDAALASARGSGWIPAHSLARPVDILSHGQGVIMSGSSSPLCRRTGCEDRGCADRQPVRIGRRTPDHVERRQLLS